MAKVVSKLIKKANKSISGELILYLRKVVVDLIRMRRGKELVEVFLDKASDEDRDFVLENVIGYATNLISEKETQ